jgi:hypothetical protein
MGRRVRRAAKQGGSRERTAATYRVCIREGDILNQQTGRTKKWRDGGLPYHEHVARYPLMIGAVKEGNGDSTQKTYSPEMFRVNLSQKSGQRMQHCIVSRKETPIVSKGWQTEG